MLRHLRMYQLHQFYLQQRDFRFVFSRLHNYVMLAFYLLFWHYMFRPEAVSIRCGLCRDLIYICKVCVYICTRHISCACRCPSRVRCGDVGLKWWHLCAEQKCALASSSVSLWRCAVKGQLVLLQVVTWDLLAPLSRGVQCPLRFAWLSRYEIKICYKLCEFVAALWHLGTMIRNRKCIHWGIERRFSLIQFTEIIVTIRFRIFWFSI
jgi:hypothetical protein